jgi:hypothetical protein
MFALLGVLWLRQLYGAPHAVLGIDRGREQTDLIAIKPGATRR